jgi:hypothetical protein
MSRRAGRPPSKVGQVGNAVTAVDPKLVAVADWLRNEKKSGLTTREAIQYEKVHAHHPPRAARAAPHELRAAS